MSRLVLIAALASALNAAEPPKQTRSWNPWRLAKALDRKLGDVSLELSAVKTGKPLGSERKLAQPAEAHRRGPDSRPVEVTGGRTVPTAREGGSIRP